MQSYVTIISAGASVFLLIYIIFERIRNGTSQTQKEIRDTYKERADQLEGIVEELKAQVLKLNADIISFRAILAEKEKHNEELTKIVQNRNPELDIILKEISAFLKSLNEKADRSMNVSFENKDLLKKAEKRNDEIDVATDKGEGNVLKKSNGN